MATKRVAICAVAQHKNEPDLWYKRFQNMLLDVLEDLQGQTGFKYGEGGVEMIVSTSDDFFDARTISNNGVTDVIGGQYLAEEKMAQEGLNAIGYANAIILSGHKDLVLIMAHCKESQGESRNLITNCGFDPFYGRATGLDYLNAAGLQAQAYMRKSGLTDDQLAEIVVRSRQWAAKNPYANARDAVVAGKVKSSPMLCDPIRQLHAYPVSDGAVGLLLASEERAREFTDKPVWITGFANCMDTFFFGDRDLTSNFALKKATERACNKAGIQDLKKSADVVEVMDRLEALGATAIIESAINNCRL
jgi:acetyl-CoA C-acetyltransferase